MVLKNESGVDLPRRDWQGIGWFAVRRCMRSPSDSNIDEQRRSKPSKNPFQESLASIFWVLYVFALEDGTLFLRITFIIGGEAVWCAAQCPLFTVALLPYTEQFATMISARDLRGDWRSQEFRVTTTCTLHGELHMELVLMCVRTVTFCGRTQWSEIKYASTYTYQVVTCLSPLFAAKQRERIQARCRHLCYCQVANALLLHFTQPDGQRRRCVQQCYLPATGTRLFVLSRLRDGWKLAVIDDVVCQGWGSFDGQKSIIEWHCACSWFASTAGKCR